MDDEKTTTIRIKDNLKTRLGRIGTANQSYENIIEMLVEKEEAKMGDRDYWYVRFHEEAKNC